MAAAVTEMGNILGHYWVKKQTNSQPGNAHRISHLALEMAGKDTEVEPKPADMFYMAQIEPLPMTNAMIHCEIKNDPVLAEMSDIMMSGWTHTHKQLCPEFFVLLENS